MNTFEYYLEEWNDLYKKVCRKENVNEIMGNYVESLIIKASNEYNKGNPIMDDALFNDYCRYLKLLKPNSEYIDKIGYSD